MLTGTAVALDAAHVRWRAFDGPDNIANGICLCVLHHLFDKGVLGLSKQHTHWHRQEVFRGPPRVENHSN